MEQAPTVMGGVSKLRTARVLETGMVLTNEPGCYFIDALINEALSNPDKSKYINVERLEQYRHTGGVRLEGKKKLSTKSYLFIFNHTHLLLLQIHFTPFHRRDCCY